MISQSHRWRKTALASLAAALFDLSGRANVVAESVELMKNRQLDATLQSAGLGVASLKDLSASMEVSMVAVP